MTSSLHSAATLPELLPPILPKDPIAAKLLKLLLPSVSVKDVLALLGLDGLCSISIALVFALATTSWVIVLLQKGQIGGEGAAAEELSFLLWQQRERVH